MNVAVSLAAALLVLSASPASAPGRPEVNGGGAAGPATEAGEAAREPEPAPAIDAAEHPADAAELGTPLRQDGYTFRPPSGFRMVRMDAFLGTRAGGVTDRPHAQRFLSAALADSDDSKAAALLVSMVEGAFLADPNARDTFSTAVVRHFNDELGLPLALERAELILGPTPRVEVLGTLKQQDQIRGILVAAMEGEGRHAVITFSVPFAQFEERLPVLRRSLDTFRPDRPPSSPWTRRLAGSVLPALALMGLGSWWLWRKRQARRRLQVHEGPGASL